MPQHGRVGCTLCFGADPVIFDSTQIADGDWRLTANPLAWGNPNAEIVLLGFSNPGPPDGISYKAHNDIIFGDCVSRSAVGQILAHLGLLPPDGRKSLAMAVDRLIADTSGRFHFGTLVRCSVEHRDRRSENWKAAGGRVFDKLIATPFGRGVAERCATRFLTNLPTQTKLVILFGMGTRGNYVRAVREVVERVRPGSWTTTNDIAYTDGKIMFVHVEHYNSQGFLLPYWLGQYPHPRASLGIQARDAVQRALSGTSCDPSLSATPSTIRDFEIQRMAKLFVGEFGTAANTKVAEKAEELRIGNDPEGVKVCRRLMSAIDELMAASQTAS